VTHIDVPVRAVTHAGGRVLAAATGLVATLRPEAKPLHPTGSVRAGTLHRYGARERTGATWLDETGDDPVVVRQSRAVGVPPPGPDIFGLAIRTPTAPGRYGDLLLASTGLGRLTRFTLTAGRTPYSRPLTTLLPYRTPAGPVLVAAVHRDETTLDLSWALGVGAWTPFAVLRLADEPVRAPDEAVSFDPVLNALPGLTNYDWVRRLREPAYDTARRSRTVSGGGRHLVG
jgi:hypothetical protein